MLVEAGKLIHPSKIAHVFSSFRQRALSALDILLGNAGQDKLVKEGKVTVTEDIAEGDYGDYEGLKPNEIRSRKK
jgi:probable phosphoglycerate mutase